MAHFTTRFETTAAPPLAFAYLADFSNARLWDPSVERAQRLDSGTVGVGSRFEVDVALAGRSLRFEYELETYEPNRLLVFRSESDRLRSLDTITVEGRPHGAQVHYDADLRLAGPYYVFDPLVHLGFQGIGARATSGLRKALDLLR